MANVSLHDVPVLQFALRPHVRDVAKRSLLWPVWGYRVVAPERRERKLNILQKAVLGLCRAGIYSAERIGKRLHLHRDLAAFLILELRERGLLGVDGLPTPEGIEVLCEETVESHRSVAGYVFQDAFSGELFPRFAERLDYVDVARYPDGFPKQILFDVQGYRKHIWLHVEWSDTLPKPIAPNAREILLAAQRHRAASRRARVISTLDAEDEFYEPLRLHLIDRVSMIEPQPRLFFLSTYVYLPQKPENGADWHVCDPLGFGAAPWLRGLIDRRIESSSPLRDLVKNLYDDEIKKKIQEHDDLLAELRRDAANRLSQRFQQAVRALPFFCSLLDAKQAAEEIDLLGENASEYHLRRALLAARMTLEASFLHFAESHPTSDVWRNLYTDNGPIADHDYVHGIYDAAAKAVGLSLPIPQKFLDLSVEHLRSAAENRAARKLRPMIMAAVLRARNDTSHPIRMAARREPKLLERIENIVKEAGDGLHAKDYVLSPHIVGETIEQLIRVMEILHGEVGHPNEQQTVAIPSNEHRLFLDQIRERMAIQLTERLSSEIRRLPFYDSMLNVLHQFEEARLRADQDPQLQLRGVLLQVRLTLELSILSIAQRYSTNDVCKNIDMNDYENVAIEAGFTSPLPKNYLVVSLDKLKRAADRKEAWMLGAMILAAVLRARDDATHPFRIAAKMAPDLLVDLAGLIDEAGDAVHAGSQILTIESVQDTVEKLVRVIGLLHHTELKRQTV